MDEVDKVDFRREMIRSSGGDSHIFKGDGKGNGSGGNDRGGKGGKGGGKFVIERFVEEKW